MSKAKIIREVTRVEKEMSFEIRTTFESEYRTNNDFIDRDKSVCNTKFFSDDIDAYRFAGTINDEEDFVNNWIHTHEYFIWVSQFYEDYEFSHEFDIPLDWDRDCYSWEIIGREIVNSNVTKVKVGSLNPYELEELLHEYPDYEIQEKVLVLKDEVSNGDESH